MTTGTTVAGTTASKAEAAKKKVQPEVVVEDVPSTAEVEALAKKEAAKTKKLGAVPKEGCCYLRLRSAVMLVWLLLTRLAQRLLLVTKISMPSTHLLDLSTAT
jgi:hypothetical protein